jgi:hypothetical protein
MDEEAIALYNHGISTLGFVALTLLGGELPAAGEAAKLPAAWSPAKGAPPAGDVA